MHKHKGFTLIEMLIVMIVLGILASMMMIASGESVSTARANNIISNLRNFSLAAMAYYTDYADDFGKNPGKTFNMTDIQKYMHNEGNIPDIKNYSVMNNNGVWWVYCSLNGASDSDRVKEKLQARASSANLCGSSGKDDIPAKNSNGTYPEYKKSNSYVWLLIRSSTK